MTLGEFIKETGRNPYQNDFAIHDNGEEGYIVYYENGYVGWSLKDVFEKAYKVADTFKDRLVIEHQELADKVLKLSLFVDGDKFPEIVPELNQRVLLLSQRERMSEYLNILNKRIETLKD